MVVGPMSWVGFILLGRLPWPAMTRWPIIAFITTVCFQSSRCSESLVVVISPHTEYYS